ncbi:MAG: hypothetical protein K8U57_07390 [Planctomycetes bacterium]|nr:hypothetical protein [Planctomycetota bacterium]
MPLCIRIEGRVAKPVIVCDHCGEEISARQGNYQWRVTSQGEPLDQVVFYTHKRCCRAFEANNRGDHRWCANDLDCLPLYLANNLGVDTESAKQKAEMIASFG